jgi:ABC-2 type transport system permease protein
MYNKFKRYWYLFWQFRKMQLLVMLEYRGDFYFWLVVGVMWTFFNFFFFSVIVGVNGHIGTWTKPEMYILLSIFTILDGFTWSWFYENMTKYTRSIFSGQFSNLLLKPIDSQFMVMTQKNGYSEIFRFLIGIGMIIWSIKQLDHPVTVWQILATTGLMGCALLFIYHLWFLVSTFAFWVEKVDNINEVVPTFRRVWQVPREVYTGVMSSVFTVVIPIGLVTSIPSEVLVGKGSWQWTMYFVLFTLALMIISRAFFYYSARKYSGVAN